jgi:UDP-N-acetylglucosamine:LPS N-acetylglucosamine transferase
MPQRGFALVTDRGGHLHNALMLVEGLGVQPETIVTTYGPELGTLRSGESRVFLIPYVFSWFGKRRVFNPFKLLYHTALTFVLAARVRPRWVISTGASDVVIFCYWAKLFGAQVYHVECMNQVVSRSVTGKLLYPIADAVFVQWEELLKLYGPKARYAGWVL